MNIPQAIGMVVVLWISLVLHERAHGWVASWLGDPTPGEERTLGLNPLYNLDWFGSVLMPAVVFTVVPFPVGYGRPTPVDDKMFLNRKLGLLATVFAGPTGSLLVALLFAGVFRVYFLAHGFGLYGLSRAGWLLAAIQYGVLFNLLWAGVNFLPVPPFDGFQLITAWLPNRWDDIVNWVKVGSTAMILAVFLLYPRTILVWIFDVLSPLRELLVGGEIMIPF